MCEYLPGFDGDRAKPATNAQQSLTGQARPPNMIGNQMAMAALSPSAAYTPALAPELAGSFDKHTNGFYYTQGGSCGWRLREFEETMQALPPNNGTPTPLMRVAAGWPPSPQPAQSYHQPQHLISPLIVASSVMPLVVASTAPVAPYQRYPPSSSCVSFVIVVATSLPNCSDHANRVNKRQSPQAQQQTTKRPTVTPAHVGASEAAASTARTPAPTAPLAAKQKSSPEENQRTPQTTDSDKETHDELQKDALIEEVHENGESYEWLYDQTSFQAHARRTWARTKRLPWRTNRRRADITCPRAASTIGRPSRRPVTTTC